MTPVLGKSALIELFITDAWYKVLCATDMDFQYNPEFILKTGPNSSARQYQLRIYDWTVSVTGLTKIESEIDVLSFFYVVENRTTEYEMRAYFIDLEGNEKVIAGNVLIGQSSITGPVSDFCNCVINFRGTGDFVIEEPSPLPAPLAYQDFSDHWDAVPGQNYVAVGSIASNEEGYTLTASDVILEVDRNGVQYHIVTGTPGDGEVRFNTGTLRMEFQNDFIDPSRIFVLFKRLA